MELDRFPETVPPDLFGSAQDGSASKSLSLSLSQLAKRNTYFYSRLQPASRKECRQLPLCVYGRKVNRGLNTDPMLQSLRIILCEKRA